MALANSCSRCGVTKRQDEKVRVVALDGSNDLNSTFTPDTFASWFSGKLANGYIRWPKLNREAIEMTREMMP